MKDGERMPAPLSSKIRPHGNTQINRNGLIIKTELADKKLVTGQQHYIKYRVSACYWGLAWWQDQVASGKTYSLQDNLVYGQP